MCCLYGILDYGHCLESRALSYAISIMGELCEVRGTDATGIAYLTDGKLRVQKQAVPAHMLTIHLPENCHAVMGHTRMTTQGSERFNRNNHPFIGHTADTPFALAHNGILHNDRRLRFAEDLPATNIETDSYIAVQLLEQRESLDFESLRSMAEKVLGSFAFTVLDKHGCLYFVRGQNPLCIYRFPSLGFYAYASTREILNKAVCRLGLEEEKIQEVEINSGDILRLGADGSIQRERFRHRESDSAHHRPSRFYRYRYDPQTYLGDLAE